MMLAAVFLIVFVVGPFGFRLLTRHRPSRAGFRLLIVFAVICVIASFTIRQVWPTLWGVDQTTTFAGIGLIWLAWIGVLALGAQILRSQDNSKRMRRWTEILGVLGSTVPWFGLAAANYFSG